MKISGTSGVERTSARGAPRRAGSASGSFHVDSAGTARAAAPLAGTSSLAAVDALLTLQAVPDPTEGKRRAVRRAGDMLDLLDGIRLSLLEGLVPKNQLEGLLRMVQSRRDEVADPGLAAVLEEIELRAQVELAKFGAFPTP